MIKVVFVCLGNICRSPMAEAVFQQMVTDAGLGDQIWVDSAGTSGWHNGKPCHAGTQNILDTYGIPYNGRSRQVERVDVVDKNTYLIVMDQSNWDSIEQVYGRSPKMYRLLDFANNTTETDVPDPYYTNGFEYVYELITDGCQGFLIKLRQWETL